MDKKMKTFREQVVEILCLAIYGQVTNDLKDEIPIRYIHEILKIADETLVPESHKNKGLDIKHRTGWEECREEVLRRIRE